MEREFFEHFYRGRRVYVDARRHLGRFTARLLALAGAHLVLRTDPASEHGWSLGDVFCCAEREGQHVSSLSLDDEDSAGGTNGAARELAGEVVRRLGGAVDLVILDALDGPGDDHEELTRAFVAELAEAATSAHVSYFARLDAYLASDGEEHPVSQLAAAIRPELEARRGGVSVLLAPDGVSSSTLAASYLKELPSGRFHIVPGTRAKLTYFLARRYPSARRWISAVRA